MKESQDQLKAKTLILTHGDSDGICSGAILYDDIALDERHSSELYPALIEFAKKCNLHYIDHHPIPKNYEKEDWFCHDSTFRSKISHFIIFPAIDFRYNVNL
jgi:hypothetical protein